MFSFSCPRLSAESRHHYYTRVLVGNAFPAAEESLESFAVEGALQRAR